MIREENDLVNIRKRYANARKLMRCIHSNYGPLDSAVFPNWIGKTDCFWYKRKLENGKEFRFVNAISGTNSLAFDHSKLAKLLINNLKCGENEVDPNNLPFDSIEIDKSLRFVYFTAFDKNWRFSIEGNCCSEVQCDRNNSELVSPDGKCSAFVKEHNLWVRYNDTGEEVALSFDGSIDYSYCAPGSAWSSQMEMSIQLSWSPDSKRIFTVIRDKRKVNTLPLVQYVPENANVRPQLETTRVAYPEDDAIEELFLLTIDVKCEMQKPLIYQSIPVTRNSWGFFTSSLGWWHKSAPVGYFVHVDRYYKYVRVVEFNAETGRTRILFEETSDTQINLMNNGDMIPTFVPLPETNELLWYSERSGWAHLYLYNLDNGQLRKTVTEGNWLVRDIVTVVTERREVFIQRGAHSKNYNPYYRDIVRVNIDTGDMQVIASSNHDYFCAAFTDMRGFMLHGNIFRSVQQRGTSPTGNYTVATRSRVNKLPETFVFDDKSNLVMNLEVSAKIGLPPNWHWPEPVNTLACDGQTIIYGVIYYPSDFSSDEKYPVILQAYNQPDFPWVPAGAFDNSLADGINYYDGAALAELGFIVIQLDGRGGSFRSKSFKDVCYGDLELSVMLADQVKGIRQLSQNRSYMDLERVGIVSHLAGGAGIIQGLLDYPDFFKVAVVACLHDYRMMPGTMWGNMFRGNTNETQHYMEDRVSELQGKLLIMGGMLDTVTPPSIMFRLINSLQKSNKDFDMILLPMLGHDFSAYFVRRSWDFLTANLLDLDPPREFSMAGVLGSQ